MSGAKPPCSEPRNEGPLCGPKCATLWPRLGRLRRNLRPLGLPGLLGLASFLAAQASAAPAPTLFRLAISGTARSLWSVTAAPVESGDCTLEQTSEGIRTATFRTRAPVLVRVSGARVLPVNVLGILGKVTLAGANTTDEICGAAGGTSNIADCARTTRAFSGATVHVASPRPGVAILAGIGNVRLPVASCPREPADVRRRPVGPALNLVQLPKEALMEQKLASITLSATRNRRKVYGSPQQGRLVETVEWTLKFVRVEAGAQAGP